MDVEDKTRFVFPDHKNNETSSDASANSKCEQDQTVFVGSSLSKDHKSSDFSISSGGSKLGDSAGFSADDVTAFHHGVTASSATYEVSGESSLPQDATVFAHSINPSSISSESPLNVNQPAPRSEQVVIKSRFELMDLLGVGGMGAVYKATDRRKLEASDSDPYVAIKVLNDDFRNHPDAFVSLQREARKSQTLAHPNIVNVHDFDRDGEMVFMTMEYLEGAPLDVLLREKAGIGLPMGQAMEVLKDISNALIYAHSHHIVHSDFKPGNIFVTSSKGAKVFDFGISRAVNPVGNFISSGENNTVFDAGSLGALTPAYASLEMLQGKDPAPSDDVYALACVAYELFCGKHPFNKVPADKAQQQKLAPKRLKQLSRRQWNALEAALAFPREKRTATVDEFVAQFYGKVRLPIWVIIFSVVSLSVAGGFYGIKYSEKVVDENSIKEELQEELQQTLIKTRAADKRASLERMLAAEEVSERWETDLRQELSDYQDLAPDDLETPAVVHRQAVEKLLASSGKLLNSNDFDGVLALVKRAEAWGADQASLDRVEGQLQQKIKAEEQKLAEQRAEEQRRKAEEQRRLNAAEENRNRERQRQAEANRKKVLAEAIARIENDLRCSTSMDIAGDLSQHMAQLNQLDSALGRRVVPDIARDLRSCFLKLQATNPQKTEDLLVDAKALFPGQSALESIKIDFCAHLKAGSGSRGARFSCQDRLASGGVGPSLVVVKSPSGGKLALGKYEVSAADMKSFCMAKGNCGNLGSLSKSLPANSISVDLAKRYLDWLSAESGHRYRLPTEQEWLSAAQAGGQKEDPDRNCHLRFGAIQKGDELVSVSVGKPNRNGLFNQVGNVQEWAVAGDGSLVALGGSREDSMSRCLITTRRDHNGMAGDTTGFRVAREL
ncbi:protein kinase [Aestuariicella sp. G3-2]|uniref:protein kinase domain-containing protein n=1 Tax=Pseudomaricurvus albidus TaxID=2842452 RepID=UPI001C0B4CEB|nr:protein kinase [Aestuariicella albida]MBU3070349.1 protein kinase [Aestuariicella albida]